MDYASAIESMPDDPYRWCSGYYENDFGQRCALGWIANYFKVQPDFHNISDDISAMAIPLGIPAEVASRIIELNDARGTRFEDRPRVMKEFCRQVLVEGD